MKNLLIYFKGYLKETILGPLFKLLEASFELLVPMVVAVIIDQVIPHRDKTHLYEMIGLLLLLALLGVTVSITAQYFSAKSAVRYTQKLSQDLFAKIMRLPKPERDALSASSLVTRITSDTYLIQTAINQFLRLFLRAPIIVMGSCLMAFALSPVITWWFIGMIGALTVVIYLITRLTNPFYRKIRQLTDTIVLLTSQQVEGMRVIRAFGQDKREEERFEETNDSYQSTQITVGRWAVLLSPLTFLIVNTALVGVIWQGNLQIQGNLLAQGSLVALINYLTNILVELLKVTMLVSSLNQAYIAAGRVTAIFEQEDENVTAALAPAESPSDQTVLAVSNLEFRYPKAQEAALSHINLTIKEGQFFGIIGSTGSGKSTLSQLLLRLYQAQKGAIAQFHQGQSPANLLQWRQNIAWVPQNAQLFKGTIRSNLTLGLEGDVSDKQLWAALDQAQASDFVREKSLQLDEPVEAFGRNFSGGQRQRLTIARALLRQAPILLLDDATSALDYLTEARLLKTLMAKTELTLLLISQRTSSLKAADNILVLENGQQVGLGQHEALLASNPIYQEIHYSQHPEERSSDESTQ
ncbi:ABC transporter ATP-binding protein [Streptococcus sp. DD12]|uniref:ABC transporter ATP-binding protein n=1 Tax=Streptococcus sp. DD12 TaxID=1777880 RepID=UPI00079481DB|nr:ABC transporter ATP-binding protein [Streptococcus sp. DD12]KXT76519.1 ABC transporter, ATP-binding/permease protein [Streptococcus sp. DD12]